MRSKWLFSRPIDLLVLYLPVWLTWAACFSMSDELLNAKLPLWIWVIFILGIDVSHVWSTIYRTYLDKEEFTNHKAVLIAAPVLSFLVFFMLASVSILWFWRVMAYFALYHFIKQQYGFLAIYRGKFRHFPKKILSDKVVIYLSMLYPVAYWHFSSKRRFNWMLDGDFFNLQTLVIQNLPYQQTLTAYGEPVLNTLYRLILAGWLVQELYLTKRDGLPVPVGKLFWVITTAVNWYLGIIYFNSDVAFSLTNVVAHGVPYMALVFYYTERKRTITGGSPSSSYRGPALRISLMIAGVLLLAFGEEFLWDMLLNRNAERSTIFESIIAYPTAALENPYLRAVAFGLLAVPQVAHYIIDGYIWKGGKQNPHLKEVFFGK